MMNNKVPEKSIDVLHLMFDSLAEGCPGNKTETENALIDLGIDTSDVVNRVRSLIEKKEKENRLSWRKTVHEQRAVIANLLASRRETIPATINGVKAAVQTLLATEDLRYNPCFRKLQSLEDADYEAILADLRDIELLEDGSE
ncbi:hypothetical protein K8T06_12630 [bacterium]|nr:hypothetical protein [bacterium]